MGSLLSGGLLDGDGAGGGGVSGLSTADGGTALADNVLVRGDGTTGIQGSQVTLSDAATFTGPTGGVEIKFVTTTDGATFAGNITLDASTAGPNPGTIKFVGGTWGEGSQRINVRGTAPAATDANNPSIALITHDSTTYIGLADGGQVKFSNGNNAENALTAGICHAGTGNSLRATDGSTGIGSLLSSRLVEANTAVAASPNVLTETESWTALTNEGATAANYHTLPTAVAGLQFTFVCQDADGIRVTANTGDTIRIADKVTAAAGYVSATEIGSSITLVAINATEWVATSASGTWTDGTFVWTDVFPMGEISYFNTTGTAITIGAQSDGSTNMVVVNPTTALTAMSQDFDNGGSNAGRLRYTGVGTKMFHIAATLSGTAATANDVFVFGVAKGGTVIAESKVLGSSGGTQFSSLHAFTSLANNEYLEVYIGNTSAGRNFTVKSLNLFAMGMA